MTNIFIGVPRTRVDIAFGSSLFNFRRELEKTHRVESHFVYGKERDEARNILAEEFLASGCDYLLFLDDDHTGHTIEMFEALMCANTEVVALKCYARYFPYQCTLMTVHKENQIYFADDTRRGYLTCQFVGFGMTLIKRSVFETISRPFFKCNDKGEREDNYFCDKLLDFGIEPVGCFDHVLPHQGIDDSNVDRKRDEGLSLMIAKESKKRVWESILSASKHEDKLSEGEREALKIIRQNFKEEMT